MGVLTYTNRQGKSINIGDDYPFILTKIEGLGVPQVDIQSRKSIYQDGESYIDNTFEPREVSIELELISDNIVEMMKNRKEIMQVFNPKLGQGEMTYSKGGITVYATAIAEIPPYFPNAEPFEGTMQPCLVQLTCHNPFLLDMKETSEEIINWIGGMTFPLKLPTRFAMAGDKIINIINEGDVETPIRLEIYGPATNPKILKRETGEFIKINRKLLSGEVMTITTEFGNKRVETDGINVFNYIDYESKFFSLDVGDNVIELTTDDVNDNANIKISYRNRYLGV